MKIVHDEELTVGHPLAADLRDPERTLLLRRGWILGEREKAIVLARQAYWHAAAPDLEPESGAEGISLDGANAFDIYGFLCARLDRILRDMGSLPGFDGYVFDLIKVINDALSRQRDAMMANIVLGRYPRYSIRHSVDTAILVQAMATQAGLDVMTRNAMVAAALTMNASMLDMQDRLHKFPKVLPDEVRSVMQSHAQRSMEMVRATGVRNQRWLDAIVQHHERLDGSGYPAGLTGSAISIEAQYVAAADSLLARMKPSAYRAMEVPSKLFMSAYEDRGKDLAGEAVSAAIKVLGCFPVGLLVRLRNGEVAVVTSLGSQFSKPIVKSIIGELGMPLLAPVVRDTRTNEYEIISVVDYEQAGVAINRRLLWGF